MTILSMTTTLLLLFLSLPQTLFATDEYTGSDKCSECHADLYNSWLKSGHHLLLRKATTAQKDQDLALPEGYSWDDISYVIGGNKIKANFVNQKGYIITSGKDGSTAKTQYNLRGETWSDYFPGEQKPYDCGGCHTTGYDPEGQQNDMQGIVGTWHEEGVGCEACHGPGSEHVKNPAIRTIRKSRSMALCESCHQRGGINDRPLIELGLVRHHEQINELKAGAHKGLTCLNCHNPHERASLAKDNCIICHSRAAMDYEKSIHGSADIKCIECHMARVPKPAIERASYIGNMQTHLFKIIISSEDNMFKTIKEKNRTSTFTKNFVAVEFACLSCHEDRDKTWALKYGREFHKRHLER